MIIIGITGTLGAGKGTVVDYLMQHKNFAHYSARKFLILDAERRGMVMNRDTLNFVANDLRKARGPHVIAESLYNMSLESDKNAIIESLHTTGEISFLREKKHFFLLGVDADIEKRYERILKRKHMTDFVTFDKFKSDQEREIENSDPEVQNIGACIRSADAVVFNNGSIDDLHKAVDKVLKKFFQEEHID